MEERRYKSIIIIMLVVMASILILKPGPTGFTIFGGSKGTSNIGKILIIGAIALATHTIIRVVKQKNK